MSVYFKIVSPFYALLVHDRGSWARLGQVRIV